MPVPRKSYYLRLSVTEACSFRCPYCLPEGPLSVTGREKLLTPAEMGRVVRILSELGVTRVRLTGGEPLLRPEILEIVETLRGVSPLREIALTSNGEELAPLARPLKEAGLDRVNIHLDSLKAARFKEITRRSDLSTVLESVAASLEAGLHPVKINMVVMRGVNDDEILDFCEFAQRWKVTVRFIELMNTGSAQNFFKRHFIPAGEIRRHIEKTLGLKSRFEDRGAAPAEEFELADGPATVGFIASESEPFCESCNRLRVTADGRFTRCLYEAAGVPFREVLRNPHTSNEDLRRLFEAAIGGKRSHHPEFGKTGDAPFAMAQIGG